MSVQREPLPFSEEGIDSSISREFSVKFLRYAVAVLMAGAAAFLAVVRLVAPDQVGRTIGPAMAVLLMAVVWILLWRGRARAAVNVMAVGTWLIVTGICIFNGGVRTPIVIVYPLLIMYAGWRVSLRAAKAVTALNAVTIGCFVLAESWGFLPKAPPTPAVMYGVIQILALALASILIVSLVRAYQNRLRELAQKEAALIESEYRWKFAIEGSGDGLWDWNNVDNTVFFPGAGRKCSAMPTTKSPAASTHGISAYTRRTRQRPWPGFRAISTAESRSTSTNIGFAARTDATSGSWRAACWSAAARTASRCA
jgi:PAS domain-containing protein